MRAAARELGISRTDALRAVQRVGRIAPAVREAGSILPLAPRITKLQLLANPMTRLCSRPTGPGFRGCNPIAKSSALVLFPVVPAKAGTQ